MSKEKEIAEEYASSLADLTVNSKPLINMLTILAEENIDHAGVIVDTVEKHLEKVPPEIKLPVLYLVDSIIKNVSGAYTQKFSQSIVNMFTKTFKQVDEKTRSQMFKLRETWHDVFPATKMYQLDVKVNLIDPAWPIQAQPSQSNIHVNPNFLKKSVPTSSTVTAPPAEDDDKMRNILAKKEQELLMLQRKKIEMELEQTRKQLELAEKQTKKTAANIPPMPVIDPTLPVKQRLGPPVVNIPVKPAGGPRIAPVSGALLASSRRDPRLARHNPPSVSLIAPVAPPAPVIPPIAPNVFDIKPLERERFTKRKNVITIDVKPDTIEKERKRRDPRLEKRKELELKRKNERREKIRNDAKNKKDDKKIEEEKIAEEKPTHNGDANSKPQKNTVDDYMTMLQITDPKKINKLPPIPKLSRHTDKGSTEVSPTKKKRDTNKADKKKKRDKDTETSPEKKSKMKGKKEPTIAAENNENEEVIAFRELKNYHKERYMKRNKEKSESPERIPVKETIADSETSSIPAVVVENKDIDLRLLHPVVSEVTSPQKRPSAEPADVKPKRSKIEKFDVLFGNEDVDLRQLPQVDENVPPSLDVPMDIGSPPPDSLSTSPKKDWQEIKEKSEDRKTPSKLDLVRAKLAEATKGKDRLGRPLLFSKSPSIEKERRRTISTEDVDLRADADDEVNKETISMILTQAKEHFKDGKMDKNQYNTLMFQVMQLNEKLKLKEAKQRESLEISKRKLRAHVTEDEKLPTAKTSPKPDQNKFGDIDERIPPPFAEKPIKNDASTMQDLDMRVPPEEPVQPMIPLPPLPPPLMGPFPPIWRGLGPRGDDFSGMRIPRVPLPPPTFFRGKFDNRAPMFDGRFPTPMLPKFGAGQGECPLRPYVPAGIPPPLGGPILIPPTDLNLIEYIDEDPMKTIDIDGIPREIRFYGELAVIMLDWEDPREIKFLPGGRRITFDNKDSVVLNFNEDYKQIEIDDQVLDIRFGAPTRELYMNGKWYECFFGSPPTPMLIDGKVRMIQIEGPPPKVDIGKEKRTDLVAGKINLIIDGQHMCPVFLDAKVQKFFVDGNFYTIRFVDSLKTVLINEVPFKVEFGGLPKPIFIGQNKHFIRFSVLPRNIKPGQISIKNMEGIGPNKPVPVVKNAMEVDEEVTPRPEKPVSPEGENSNHGGLDMLASLMPSSMAPSSGFSGYSLAEPMFTKTDNIPGLESNTEEPPQQTLPALGNINVNDLFAKLVASGIVQVPDKKEEVKEMKEDPKSKLKEDKNVIHPVDLLRPETLRIAQPALVSRLYGGMQCSGCGARFPPEHTVRYSQHLDWHFRQNRRERDSARRAHSRHWHYDLSDWVQYEEIEDLEEREKSWFENPTNEGVEPVESEPVELPSVKAGLPADRRCALCNDTFDQFYNEDKDEWHLRKAVRFEDKNYHPICFEDYKASLTKEEEPSIVEIPAEESKIEEKTEEAIEIGDVDSQTQENIDDDVIEVIEDKVDMEPVEIDEGDEDDVIYKAEPVEEVIVDDDCDTDDETKQERAERDKKIELDFSKVKIKQEPIDPDDEPVITAEEEAIRAKPDTTSTTILTSIDGNFELNTPQIPSNEPITSIRINITKSIPSFITNNDNDNQSLEDISASDEPLPPGEEPELEYKLKPALEGIQLSRQPPVNKGQELSGLCSIM